MWKSIKDFLRKIFNISAKQTTPSSTHFIAETPSLPKRSRKSSSLTDLNKTKSVIKSLKK